MNSKNIEIPDYVQAIVDKTCLKLYTMNYNELEAELPIKPGCNWLGEILKITAKIDQNNKDLFPNLSLIAKILPSSKLYRNLFSARIVFDREVYMYEKVLPEFIKIQQENNIDEIFAPFVKCFETSSDENREVILLENMNVRGYRMINYHKTVDYDHAALAMKTLGKFHALSFALREQKPEMFKEFGNNTRESYFSSSFRNLFVKVTQNLSFQILKQLQKGSEVFRKFENFIMNPNFVIDEIMKPELAEDYSVIGHGDFQTKNLMWKYESNLKPNFPTDICLLDWQLSRIGSPCLDVSMFLWFCTDKDLRKFHYKKLLEIYYSNFSSFLKDLGGSSEISFPVTVFKEHLKKFSVIGLYLGIWVILGNMTDSQDTPDITDCDGIESAIHVYSSTVCNDSYFTTMKNLIEDFVECGYNL
ncbi:hypothetical protein FQR65_LT00912 [Abscondita terminalis]|nr:hypothetical protein FQR65_LT00912 [Abscondita terminalis]